MKPSELSSMTRQQLQDLAKRKKIPVTSNLRKEELVSKVGRALRKRDKEKAAAKQAKAVKKATVKTSGASPRSVGKSTAAGKPKAGARPAAASKKTKATPQAKTQPQSARAQTGTPGQKAPKKTAAKKALEAKKKAARKARVARTETYRRSTAKTRVPPPTKVDAELASKYILGPAPIHDESEREVRMDLPAGYGDHRLVMMVRDPYWVHCYWELQPQYIEDALKALDRSIQEVHWVLRMYSGAGRDHFFDTEISQSGRSHYVHLAPPGATFTAEIGVRDGQGHYATVVRSNSVTLPRDRPSSNMDEQWMLSDEELHHHYAGVESSYPEGAGPLAETRSSEGQPQQPSAGPGGASEYRPPSSSKK
ncbi:DUF4912 domain-containing protein [Nitrospina watsonii]|uniref:Rho termination factor N-terminal domain-containing protein n=1 Tax=Nitrospina watsonii TaxID=1323948 RepID=A0ABM9HAN2_9BACT|nr:DUF4912 domain-containing protein [Nitrospina watsonii]CAI2717175.1 protein of unknown function [Nitrospina watsonii]